MISQALIDRTFDALVAVALKGERCPVRGPIGEVGKSRIPPDAVAALARAGRIRIAIYIHNWRVVTILDGPHKGKHTALPPGVPLKPYKTIDGGGTRTGRGFTPHGSPNAAQPSAPRPLTRDEIKRL